MTDSTLDITQSFDRPQKLLRLLDNGDGTYSFAASSPTIGGGADGLISVGNTTEVNLAGGATFEGAFENVLQYGGIRVAIYSSHASASRGLEFWCSKDGNNGFIDDSYTVPATTAKTYAIPVSAPYFKVRYTNGSTQTTTLKICTIFQRNVSVVSSHRIGDSITSDDDAQLVQAVLKAQLPNGTYSNIDATAGGNLKVSIEEVDAGAYPFITTRDDDFYNDAFQRMRVSDTDQRFDAEFKYDKQPLMFDDISAGGGATTFDGNARMVTIATGATGTGVVAGLRQHWANPYTPGNSQFIALTGIANGANLAGRAEVFLRTSVTGSVTEEVIPQSSWVAKTTGVEWRYSQIFLMDFQSLKVGRIRFGLDAGGLAVKVAEITNDNEKAFGYWQLADQPVYYRQYNTADYTYTEIGYGDEANAIGFRFRTNTPQSSQTMAAICATVKSEGGGDIHDIAGIRSSAGNGTTKKTVSTTMIPVISFQLKGTFNTYPCKGIVFPTGYEVTTDNPIYYEIRVNPSLTGASFASVGNDSILNVDTTASAITGGRVIKTGYASSSGAKTQATSSGILNKIPLGVSAAGVGDIITICAIRDGTTNASVGTTMDFNEVR